ncbi:MAG TPA: hypothetical protein ENN67_01005, partial [Firmicutes bacterium]|nr:hypothetical protein [Bacillota bacterium]
MSINRLCIPSVLGIIIAIGLLSCSHGGGNSPLTPGLTGTDLEMTPAVEGQTAHGTNHDGDRFLWGLWQFNVSPDHDSIEVIPLREAAFHLNVVGYLENPPGTQLLKIVNVSQTPSDTLLVDIQLIHPFPGKPQFTGRDVRGIAIFPAQSGGKLFPSTIVTDVDGQLAQIYASRWLVNADGYTTLWNRWMHEQVFHPKILGYIRGKLATPNEAQLQGNLHGFKAFWTDPVFRIFQSNQAATRTYELDVPPGPLSFAYAVDASWDVPLETPVTDPWNDFATSANSPEPYQIIAAITANSLTKVGGSATVQFDVFDWQDATNFSHVHVEAPDLFSGTIDPGAPIMYPTPNSARYEVIVPNTNGNAQTAKGGSDLLIVVEDVENSTVNPDLTAYHIVKLPVADVPGFWRDRHGNSTFVNVPITAPMIEPSTYSTGQPDLAVISNPEPAYAIYNGNPEIMVFDDNNQRFVVYNRQLTASWVKSGYPGSTPPSWLLHPHCVDSTNTGWFGVGSTGNTPISGTPYQVKHVVNMFSQAGIYGYSWYPGGAPTTFETIRDATNGMGNVTLDPLYAFFAYSGGVLPAGCTVLSVGHPYTDPLVVNTFKTTVPRSDVGGVPGAVYHGAERLRTAIDTDAFGSVLYQGFYVLESNPSIGQSEIEGFRINFSNIPTTAPWHLSNADINAEFPGAWAVDVEVVPSGYNGVTIVGDTKAQFNWLCVLMENATDYWLAFYDPVNPVPNNPG